MARTIGIERAVRRAIEPLEGRILLAVVNSLVDPLTGAGVDTTKWAITNRGLENNAPAGYNDPVEDANGLVLGGTTNNHYWFGSSLESQDDFSSQARTTVQVERVSLTGSGTAWRSSLWLLQPGGQYLHFAENVRENNWEYNPNNTGSGTAIGSFNTGTQIDRGDHTMKVVYVPGAGTTADFQIYLDGTLGTTVHYTSWDHSKTFKVILTGQGRATADTVAATFKNFSAVADPIPTLPPATPTNLTAVAATQGVGATLTWLDNANNEISYRVERSTDGVKFTEVATLPAVAASGTTVTYNDPAPAAGTKFYYRVRAFNNANNGSFSGYSNVATATTVPAITSLVDPLTGNGVDTTKWDITKRGLESSGDAGYNAPVEDANGLVLGGTATNQYWYGSSLESKGLFNSQASTTVTVDRVQIDGTGTAFRSSLWLLQPVPGGQFLHFSQNFNETGWEYNQTTGGGGTAIGSFGTDPGDHVMKLVYTPLGFTNAKVDIYLDDNLGATANFTNWDNTVPFKVILTGQGRAIGDTVAATFKSFSAVADPLPAPPAAPSNFSVIAGTAGGTVNLQWTDNATNELGFSVERSIDGTNWTTVASPAASADVGGVLTYTDAPPLTGASYFYRVRAFNYSALGTFVSTPVLVGTPVITTLTGLTDPLTGPTVDTTKWDVTNRGLENAGEAGYFDPTEDANGLALSGNASQQYWFGKSLESKGVFSSAAATTVTVHRTSLSGSGSAYRSSLWLLQPGGQFLHFAQDVNETQWQYNQTAGNIGTAIAAFDAAGSPYLDGGDHEMKLVYTPLGGTNAKVDMYLDGTLGATANFTNWDNSQPFKVILTGQARAIGDSVTATFRDLAVTATPPAPTTIAGTAAADTFYLKANADGTHADVWVNSATPGTGAPTQQILLGQPGQLVFDGQGGDDVLTIDYSAGNPVPGAGVLFQGGAGNDRIKTIGAGAADALGFIGLKVQHAGSGLVTAASDVERLGVSAAAFATPIVTPGSAGNFGTYDIGKGASVQLFYTGASPVAQVRAALSAGRHGGAWDGPGLTSTDAGVNRSFGIGYTDDPASGTILLKYAQVADATLDGKVDFNDLVKLAQNYNVTGGRTWATGDFNYDGNTDFNDLVMLAQNYNTTAPAPAPLSLAAAQTLAASMAASLAPAPAKTPAPPAKPKPAPAPKPVAAPKPAPKPVVTAKAPVAPPPKATPFASSKKVGAKELLA